LYRFKARRFAGLFYGEHFFRMRFVIHVCDKKALILPWYLPTKFVRRISSKFHRLVILHLYLGSAKHEQKMFREISEYKRHPRREAGPESHGS